MITNIGKHTYGQANISLNTWGEGTTLSIGNFCSIANNIEVFLGGGHRTDWITTYPFGHVNCEIFNTFNGIGHPKTNGNVVIGNDVWIGAGCTIMSGITISDGAVLAANSHVVKDVEPYSIVGGNPAKHIKYRFSKEQIEALLTIQWWNWADEKIKENCSVLCNNNIDELIKIHKK